MLKKLVPLIMTLIIGDSYADHTEFSMQCTVKSQRITFMENGTPTFYKSFSDDFVEGDKLSLNYNVEEHGGGSLRVVVNLLNPTPPDFTSYHILANQVSLTNPGATVIAVRGVQLLRYGTAQISLSSDFLQSTAPYGILKMRRLDNKLWEGVVMVSKWENVYAQVIGLICSFDDSEYKSFLKEVDLGISDYYEHIYK